MFVKLPSGVSKTLELHNDMSVGDVKEQVERVCCIQVVGKLIFAGKELNGGVLGDYGLGKESTLHVTLPRPCGPAATSSSAAPPEDEEEEDEEGTEEFVAPSLISRPNPMGMAFERFVDFDRHDGWATVQGLNVAPIQQWLRERDRNLDLSWIPYGGNELQYFLDDASHTYAEEMALHLKEWFG